MNFHRWTNLKLRCIQVPQVVSAHLRSCCDWSTEGSINSTFFRLNVWTGRALNASAGAASTDAERDAS